MQKRCNSRGAEMWKLSQTSLLPWAVARLPPPHPHGKDPRGCPLRTVSPNTTVHKLFTQLADSWGTELGTNRKIATYAHTGP